MLLVFSSFVSTAIRYLNTFLCMLCHVNETFCTILFICIPQSWGQSRVSLFCILLVLKLFGLYIFRQRKLFTKMFVWITFSLIIHQTIFPFFFMQWEYKEQTLNNCIHTHGTQGKEVHQKLIGNFVSKPANSVI